MKKSEKVTNNLEFVEYDNPNLTRIDPTTAFVIDHKSGRCLYLFRKKDKDYMVQKMIDRKMISSPKQLRLNRYGDLLIVKK